MSNGRLTKRLVSIENQLAPLSSQRSINVLTNKTTRGVFQAAKPGTTTMTGQKSTVSTARWG